MNSTQLQTLNAPNNNWIVGLIGAANIGPNWNWLVPKRNEIYFSFFLDTETPIRYEVSSSPASFLNDIQQSAVKHALNYISSLTGIQFIESTSNNADLFFANVDIANPKYSAMAVSQTLTRLKVNSDEIDQLSIYQYIFFDNVEFGYDNLNPEIGSIGYETLLHELGHTLGLKHPFESNPNLSLFEDTTFFTLMSYTHFGIKDTFSAFDLSALMYLYGGDGVGGEYGYLENTRVIWGTNRTENIVGSTGNDVLKGLEGNDRIDGNDGFDLAIYDAPAIQYELKLLADRVVLTATKSLEGTDTLLNIEKLQFTDRSVIIESKSHGSYADLPTELYQFFITAFNAAPGVTYMDQLAEAYRHGLSVKQIAAIFTTKKQFTDVYSPSLSHENLAAQLVHNIVKNSASASAKSEAIADIKDALNLGWTLGDVTYTVFGNLAQKSTTDPVWGSTVKQFNHEIAVAKFYTETLNQSTTDLDTLRDVIQPVNQATDVSSDVVMAQLIGVALLTGGIAI